MAKANPSIFSSYIGGLASQQQMYFDIAPEDRISKLPDPILSHILSFLPTEYSVRTSCLSKRWRFTWTWVVVLDLNDRLFKSSCFGNSRKRAAEEAFTNFVNKVLILRSHVCVKRFRLELTSTYSTSDVHSWISAAVMHDVEELDLRTTQHNVKLPMILFISATLVLLKLHYEVELNIPKTASLPSLKVVHLQCVSKLRDVDIIRLLSASPVLQELLVQLSYQHNIKTFSVLSKSLRTFILRNNPEINHVVIDAPKLEYIEFIDTGHRGIDIEFKNTDSIVKAIFGITGSKCGKVPAIDAFASSLCSFCNVKVLSLSSFILKAALSCERDVRLNSLTKLVVGYCVDDLSILPQILKRLPSLEALVLNKQPGCDHTVKCEDWKQEKSEISCLKYSLKTLQLGRFKGSEQDMPILEYFMENAAVLNEVRTSTEWISETKPENAILKKVLAYPRFCSNAYKIIIS